jgi:hypothetical protein
VAQGAIQNLRQSVADQTLRSCAPNMALQYSKASQKGIEINLINSLAIN